MAAHLGMTQAELGCRMPAKEFRKWMVLEQIEPFGDRRLDLLCGILASTFARLSGVDCKVQDFIPDFDGDRSEAGQTAEQQLAILQAISLMYGNG